MNERELEEVQAFVNEFCLPADASSQEKLIHSAVTKDMQALLDEVYRLRRENANLLKAAKHGAMIVTGNFTMPAGSTLGFLFLYDGEMRVESINNLYIGADSQIGREIKADEASIVEMRGNGRPRMDAELTKRLECEPLNIKIDPV